MTLPGGIPSGTAASGSGPWRIPTRLTLAEPSTKERIRMNQTLPLELTFRGERTYLHGTDLYQGILAALGDTAPPGPVSLTFHSLLKNQPDLIFGAEDLRQLREDPTFRGELRLGSRDALVHAALMESTRPVTLRRPCNEVDVTTTAVVDEAGKFASIHEPQTGCPIEQVVFLNKHLHLHLLPHLSPKWLFARLELTTPLPQQSPRSLKVVLKQVLGNRFTRSEVLFDDLRVGHISFSTPQS